MGKWYHNGNGTLPVLADKLKISLSDDYTGGTNSFPTISGTSTGTGKYMAFAIAEDTFGTSPYFATVTKYIVIEFDTAEVVAVYNCPIDFCDDNKYIQGGRLTGEKYKALLGHIQFYGIASGLNEPAYNSTLTVVANFAGVIYTTEADSSLIFDITSTQLINIIETYLDNGTLPNGYNIALIEKDNATQDGSNVTFDDDGFLQNGGQLIRIALPQGRYTGRMFIGGCKTISTSSAPKTISSL